MSLPCIVIAHPAAESPSLDDECLSTVQKLVRDDFRTVVYLTSGTPFIEQLVESGAEVRIVKTVVSRAGRPGLRRFFEDTTLAVRSALNIWKSLTREDPRLVIADSRVLPLWRLVAGVRGYPSSGYKR